MKSICNVLSPIVVYAVDLGNWVACGIQKMFGVSRELGDLGTGFVFGAQNMSALSRGLETWGMGFVSGTQNRTCMCFPAQWQVAKL